MFAFTFFALSGAAIITLAFSKRVEEKQKIKTGVFILRLISRGDETVRHLHHRILHSYSEDKAKIAFWLKKQLPLKLKSWWNKSLAYLKEKSVTHLGDIRNSRLLKKDEGISEFFKNISEIEKGGGEINDEVYVAESVPVTTVEKKPRKKKVKVVEIL